MDLDLDRADFENAGKRVHLEREESELYEVAAGQRIRTRSVVERGYRSESGSHSNSASEIRSRRVKAGGKD